MEDERLNLPETRNRGVGCQQMGALLHSNRQNMFLFLIVVTVAYLLGAIPFGFLLVWLVRKEDIRAKGSGNIGATNVLRSGAKGLGILTFVLDALKGFAAVAVAQTLFRGQALGMVQAAIVLAALFVVLGHMYPVWLRFKGGKGVATAFGAFLAFCPLAALSALGLWGVVVVLTRYVSLASILAAVTLPFLTLWLGRFKFDYATGVTMFASCWIVVAKHWPNMQRLLHGTEHRFGAKKAAA